MTTLVTLATKDAVVLGSDSLATTTKRLIDPFELFDYFDPEDGFRMRLNDEGLPALGSFMDVINRSRSVPYDHMTDMHKLFDLGPLPMGAMYTGITSIGNRTIRSLLGEFKQKDKAFRTSPNPSNYTVKTVTERLVSHLASYYNEVFQTEYETQRPTLELLVAGYDKRDPLPTIVRASIDRQEQHEHRGFGLVFGGIFQEIQRIIYGVDVPGVASLEERYAWLLRAYQQKVREMHGPDLELPDLTGFFEGGYHIFGKSNPESPDGSRFDLSGLVANWGDFSEQNAIDCVAWLIGIMREAHRFSSKMPTVGGAIHIALVTKEEGLRFISREEYRHEDHRVQRVLPRARS